MPAHFLNLEGAQTLATREFNLTQLAVKDVVASCAMGLVYGDAGLGKTYSVASALECLAVPYSQHEFGAKTTTKTIAARLLHGLTGVMHGGTRERIEVDLIDALSDQPHLFAIDEAQRLSHDPVEYLRHLWDHPRTRCSFLLVGGNGCWELLQRYPMLRSRFYRRIEFRPLSLERILNHIPKFHPIYRDAEPELIREIDFAYGHGNLRDWASLTHTLVDLAQRHDHPLDRELISNALALHGSP